MSDVPNAENNAINSPERPSVDHLIELGYTDPLAIADQQRREAAVCDESLKQAQRLTESGALADAIELLTRLAEQSPEWPGPHRLLARAYFQFGEFDAANSELRWLELHGFEHVEFALLRATISLKRRELDDALDQAQYARCLRHPLPAADLIMGEVHRRRGDLKSAEAALQRALTGESRTAAALAEMAAVCLGRDDFESAADWALQALEADMRLTVVHYHLGLALMRMGRRVEAASALGMAAQLNRQLAGPHRRLAEIYEDSDGPRAAEHRRLGRDIVACRRRARAMLRSQR